MPNTLRSRKCSFSRRRLNLKVFIVGIHRIMFVYSPYSGELQYQLCNRKSNLNDIFGKIQGHTCIWDISCSVQATGPHTPHGKDGSRAASLHPHRPQTQRDILCICQPLPPPPLLVPQYLLERKSSW